MDIFKTTDNIAIEFKRSHFKPTERQDGMHTNGPTPMWVKLPTRDWYRVQSFRSTMHLKELIEKRTLDQVEILIDVEVL